MKRSVPARMCLIIFATALSIATPVFAQSTDQRSTADHPKVDMLLLIEGMEGGSEVIPGGMVVKSFSQGVHFISDSSSGGGGGGGEARLSDFTVVKEVDKSSPRLMESCATGQTFPRCQFFVRKQHPDGEVEYYCIALKDVQIMSVVSSGSADDRRRKARAGRRRKKPARKKQGGGVDRGGASELLDKVTLSYQHITWTHLSDQGVVKTTFPTE